jgi:hypothetical protein
VAVEICEVFCALVGQAAQRFGFDPYLGGGGCRPFGSLSCRRSFYAGRDHYVLPYRTQIHLPLELSTASIQRSQHPIAKSELGPANDRVDAG